VVTSHGQGSDGGAAAPSTLGALGYVLKPVDNARLSAMVERAKVHTKRRSPWLAVVKKEAVS